jgi:hypothetical protein
MEISWPHYFGRCLLERPIARSQQDPLDIFMTWLGRAVLFNADITEAYQSSSALIPKGQPDTAKAIEQRETTHIHKLWKLLQSTRKIVKRYSPAKVMDMVHAYIRIYSTGTIRVRITQGTDAGQTNTGRNVPSRGMVFGLVR